MRWERVITVVGAHAEGECGNVGLIGARLCNLLGDPGQLIENVTAFSSHRLRSRTKSGSPSRKN